jgi:peptide/nickel transport system substrate-binding protein
MAERWEQAVWRSAVARRAFLRGVAATGAVASITSLAACASPSAGGGATSPTAPAGAGAPAATTAAAAPAAATPQVKLGGAFRTAFQTEMPNMDVHQVNQLALQVFGPGVAYSKLVQYRADAKAGDTVPTGDLAESWEQPDEATYIFKLRRGARFHNVAPVNGREVVAEDIRYSYERQTALKINAGRLPKLDKVEVVDPFTLKLTALRPDADFLVTLAATYNKVVPKESVEVKGDLKEGPIIGSGPWLHENWQRDKVASLVKNPAYYAKGYPRVDRLDLLRVADAGTQFAALRARELDQLSGTALTPADADNIRKTNPDIVLETYKNPQGVWMNMNAAKAPFSDPRVRQAIFKAIDKQAIMDTVFNGQTWYYAGVRMPSEDYYLPEAEIKALYKQDVEAARRLLGEVNAAAIPEFEFFVLGLGSSYKDVAELIQSDLAKVGLRSRIKVSDTPASWSGAVYTQGTYDIVVGATTPLTANSDLSDIYSSRAIRNMGVVKDPAFDALIDKQAVMVKDPEGRKKILQDIQRKIVADAQAFYLLGYISPSLRWPYLKDFNFTLNLEEPYARLWLDK